MSLSRLSEDSRWNAGRSFVVIIGTLCMTLVLMIGYFFYSLGEIKNITPQPYVTIINNHISAKAKLLAVKNEVWVYTSNPTPRALTRLQIKTRAFRSSILQDFQSQRTQRIHELYGNLERLAYIRRQTNVAFDEVQKITSDDLIQLNVALTSLDQVYSELNLYLSTFVANVQKNQMEFVRYKDDFYDRQYLYLTLILGCSILMIGVISWMYLNQSKLSRDLQERSEKLAEAKHLAEQSANAKARFLANMSHEMRTPLNAIIGLSEKEYYRKADEQTQGTIAMINNSGLHLLKLINSVLDISKIEKGKMKLEQERFYCSELIEQSKTIFFDNSKRDVEIFFSTQMVSNVELVADKTKLVQLINNLSYNALKFTDKGSVDVHLSLERNTLQQDVLLLQITDTGIGMSAEHLDKVFDEFTQADDSITRRYGGTGLGLAICQSLVSLMGGTIDVHSELNVGTQFIVTLPVELDERNAVRYLNHQQRVRVVSDNAYAKQLISSELQRFGLYDESGDRTVYYHSSNSELDESLFDLDGVVVISDRDTPLPDNLSRLAKPYDIFTLLHALGCEFKPETVADSPQLCGQPEHALSALIVEDTRVNQVVAQKMLDTLQVSTVIADNGQQCIDILKQRHFDIIFMDIQMPVMDGIEAMKRIEQENLAPDSAIIALTANTFGKDVLSYLELGFNDVVPKPVRLDLMKRVIAKYS